MRDGGIRTRDPLTPSHEPTVAGRRWVKLGEPVSCANAGQTSLAAAEHLATLAPFGSPESDYIRHTESAEIQFERPETCRSNHCPRPQARPLADGARAPRRSPHA